MGRPGASVWSVCLLPEGGIAASVPQKRTVYSTTSLGVVTEFF